MTRTRQLTILKDMLNIETVNGMNNEFELANYINSLFHDYGIESKIINIDEGLVNIIAIIKGKNELQKIIFNGHLDTVPYGNIDLWNHSPSKSFEDNSKIYARGASDMKSGLAAMVCSFCMIAESGILPNKTIIFIGTSDEERNGVGAQAIAKSHIIEGSDALIIGEPTYNKIGLAEKGCIWLECNFTGKTSHGAYPEKGINSIEVGYAFYKRLNEYVCMFSNKLLGNSTISLNKINGGIFPNMVPDKCLFLFDIRPVLPLNSTSLLKQITIIINELKKEFGKFSVDYKILNNRRALEVSKENQMVSEFAKSVKRISKTSVKYTGINFFSDGSLIVNNNDKLPIFLFGPGDPELAHKPNENVKINLYVQAIEIFFDFMLNCE